MSTVDKTQLINGTMAASAIISVASLHLDATRIGRIANCALVLSIAARVLAGTGESANGEPPVVTPSQSSLSSGVDIQGMLINGLKAVKAVNEAARKWAIAVKAEQAAAANPQVLVGIPLVPPVAVQTPPAAPTATASKTEPLKPTPQVLVGIPLVPPVAVQTPPAAPAATASKTEPLKPTPQVLVGIPLVPPVAVQTPPAAPAATASKTEPLKPTPQVLVGIPLVSPPPAPAQTITPTAVQAAPPAATETESAKLNNKVISGLNKLAQAVTSPSIDKSQTTQRINKTIAVSAAISVLSLYFKASRIGSIANSVLVLSIAARVLAGNAKSANGASPSVTPSQSSLPFVRDIRKMLTKGENTVKAAKRAARKWAIAALKAEQAAATTPLVGIPLVPPAASAAAASKTKTEKPTNSFISGLKKMARGVTFTSANKGRPTLGLLSANGLSLAPSANPATAQTSQPTQENNTTVTTPAAPSTGNGVNSSTTSSTNTTTNTAQNATLTTAPQAPETVVTQPAKKENRIIRLIKYFADFTRPGNEEEQQLQKAIQESLQTPPRVVCNPCAFFSGTKNQFDLPGGNTACTAIAGAAALAMLLRQLQTPDEIDQVLNTGVEQYKSVLRQLGGFKTDANQTQLLGWDQCYHGGFNAILQSPEESDQALKPSSIALSSNKNSYLEALEELQQEAIQTGNQQVAILIMYPFTYAVSITHSQGRLAIQLFDSHGSLAYDVLGGSNKQASIASFNSVNELAEYLKAKKPFDPQQAQTSERNQFGLYKCELRPIAEPALASTTSAFTGAVVPLISQTTAIPAPTDAPSPGKASQAQVEQKPIIAHHQAIQSAISLEELLKNRSFITTCEKLLNTHNVGALVYLDSTQIAFLKEEVLRNQQFATKLQEKATTFLKTLATPSLEGQKFQRDLEQLQERLAELQENLPQTSSWDFVPTATTAPTPLDQLRKAPEKYRAQIEKWGDSIDGFRQRLTHVNKDTELWDDVKSLQVEAIGLHESITALQAKQESVPGIKGLLSQIETIIDQAADLKAEIQQKLEQPPAPAPTAKPTSKPTSIWSRLSRKK